ncbi:MAG: sialidase family protein [Pirellulaceae bacterium]
MLLVTTGIVLALGQTTAAPPLLTPPTDYGRSFVATAGGAGNQPVFWLESRCRISDPATGEIRDYYQCASCKSENTFAPHDLFHENNYDFLPVFSDKETIIFRRAVPIRADFRQVVSDSPWGKATPMVRTAKMRVLTTPDEIVSAIEAAVPIISQTELRDAATGRTAIIECPIKTMNMSSSRRIYQVDTGPVLLPDLTLPPEQWSAGLRLAFIAFNESTWADFIVDEPTPVTEGIEVHHFSRRLHFTSKNVLLALDDGSLPWEVKTRTPAVTEQGEITKIDLLPPDVSNPRNSEGDFIQLSDGRILLVYTHFTGGGGDDDAAFLAGRFSGDGGATWTPDDVTVVPNEGRWNVMSVSLLRLQSGEIALFYLCKQAADDCRAYLRTSTDEGQTWSEPTLCIPPGGYYVVNNDRVIQLANGRLVIPAARHVLEGETQFRAGVAMCFVSDDNGKTWTQSAEIAPPQHSGSGLQEPGILELKDGRIMMLCRTDQGCQYRCYSSDGGLTWSGAEPTNIRSPCSPATFERIPQTGDILMVWNDHSVDPALGQKRTPLTVAISKDEGQTWERAKHIEEDPDGWFCYTALDFVGVRVLLAYCATGAGLPALSCTRVTYFNLDWVYTE